MKTTIYILLFLILAICCTKDNNETVDIKQLEPYIKNLISPDTLSPFIGNYYIHVNYKDPGTSQSKEMTFSETDQSITQWYYPSDVGLGMSKQGVGLYNPETSEHLEITFYFNTDIDTAFKICYGNYFFADPWTNTAGANIGYFRPVDISDPSTQYFFLGTNSTESSFKITYIGNNRLNGTFQTTWKECCGGPQTYIVNGDFSIPSIHHQ